MEVIDLAVIKNKGGTESIHSLAKSGGWAELPDGSFISPAYDGISGGDYRISKIDPGSTTPKGFKAVGRRVDLVEGVPVFVESLEDDFNFPELTHRQFWLAAWDVGITKQSVTAKVLSSYPEEERDRIAMEVELTTTFSRNHPLVDELCVMSGLSPVELDSLWEWASSI